MREIRLRWSPLKRGFFAIPGDDIRASGAQPFWLKGAKLADPDLFNQAAMDHHWPRLPVERHRTRITIALAQIDVSAFDKLSGVQQTEASLAIMKLLDAESTVEECLDDLEDIAA